MGTDPLDAVVVGAGPNGLMAGVTLASAGLGVRVYEAADTIGGAARTAALTRPGFRHDLGSAVHPFAAGSPAFALLPLADHGLTWIEPELALAHPFDDRPAATLARSFEATVAGLGDGGRAYRRLLGPFVGRWQALSDDLLHPVAETWPRHPWLTGRFACRAALPVSATRRLVGDDGVASLLAGMAGHTGTPLGLLLSAGPALMLALAAHDVGWPVPRGGAQAIPDALAACLAAAGGSITTGQPVASLDELPPARAYLLDVTPWALPDLAGTRLPDRYVRRLQRYRRGPGVFKVDYALSEPVPWSDDSCRRAGTVHLGGRYADLAAAFTDIARGRAPTRPLVVAAQPSRFDDQRAPAGHHTFWTYAHVPNGWTGDLTPAIEAQVERFAPGFGDVVLERVATSPSGLERNDANLVGGDLGDGAFAGLQMLFRPNFARIPYATPHPAVYLCSAATPPGPGVHGICGYEAARVALRRVFGRRVRRFELPTSGNGRT